MNKKYIKHHTTIQNAGADAGTALASRTGLPDISPNMVSAQCGSAAETSGVPLVLDMVSGGTLSFMVFPGAGLPLIEIGSIANIDDAASGDVDVQFYWKTDVNFGINS